MKKKAAVAIIMAAIMALSAITVLAQENGVPAETEVTEVTALFLLVDPDGPGDEFAMESEDGLVIYITNNTPVYFEDYLPLCDYCEELTNVARELLFDRTLAEVLNNRNLHVVLLDGDYTNPVSVTILFETIVALPEPINGEDLDLEEELELEGDLLPENGYIDIQPLPEYIGDVDLNDNDPLALIGELVVNGTILENAPEPFLQDDIVMVPLRAVATALDYDVTWNPYLRSVQMGVAIHIWIGDTEAHVGRMAPIELSTAPILVNDLTFVPLDFFRNVLGQAAYVFEGQVVIETYSDME